MSTPVPAAVLDDVRRRLAGAAGDLTPHRVAEALRASGSPVGDATVLAVHDVLRRDVLGAGPLEELLRLPDVTDVLVNGPTDVWIDRGRGLEPASVVAYWSCGDTPQASSIAARIPDVRGSPPESTRWGRMDSSPASCRCARAPRIEA